MSAIDDLSEAYPKLSREELENYRDHYEGLLKKHGRGVPFEQHARGRRNLARAMRRAGLPDDPPHPESRMIFEYDPPLPRCPECSSGTSLDHMDAPREEAEIESWREEGYPGKRQCPKCLWTLDVGPLQAPRIFKRVRWETFDEVLGRKAAEEFGEDT